MVPALDAYLFDLHGFLVLRGAVGADELADLNAGLDAHADLKPGQWRGHVHGHSYSGGPEGINLQQIYEGGAAFERLIDHPSWIEHLTTFIGGAGSFDGHHGPLFIDEAFATLRAPGEAIGLHSGAANNPSQRCQYQYRHGAFHCGQVNMLLALNDIGPGDGATVVIPGSHKANLPHPEYGAHCMRPEGASAEGVTGSIEVHLRAGDALLFVDAIAHGSARRSNPGFRRTVVYRYGPSWGMFRHGYRPSRALLERLTPVRRRIVWPHEHTLKPVTEASEAFVA